MPGKATRSLRRVVLFGMLGALTFALKVAMSPLPNIEPVSLLVMLYAAVLGWPGLCCVYLYVLLEILFYGIQLWNINYLYIWAILFVAARLLRNMRHPLAWAVLSGAFGALFGALCAPVYAVTGGIQTAVGWWISGIPYDLLHCAGNFTIALALFCPLRTQLTALAQKLLIQAPD